MRYTKLNLLPIRRLFDPSKKEDQDELKYFIQNGRWRDRCPFYSVYPWEDIPSMCKDMYTKYKLLNIK